MSNKLEQLGWGLLVFGVIFWRASQTITQINYKLYFLVPAIVLLGTGIMVLMSYNQKKKLRKLILMALMPILVLI